MIRGVKKLVRSTLVNMPFLQDTIHALKRRLRTRLGIFMEGDFNALALFPGIDGKLCLDVGANRGQTADAILKRIGNSRVRLFEPNPLLSESLKKQYCGDERVIISELGLGEKSGECTLYVPYYRKWMFDGLAGFDREKASRSAKNRIFLGKSEDVTLLEVNCSISRLDELDLEPAFISLDIEGYELSALKGGTETIRRHEPLLLIEHPGRAVIDYLGGLEYRPYAFEGGRFVLNKLGDLNTFFMTESRAALVAGHIDPP